MQRGRMRTVYPPFAQRVVQLYGEFVVVSWWYFGFASARDAPSTAHAYAVVQPAARFGPLLDAPGVVLVLGGAAEAEVAEIETAERDAEPEIAEVTTRMEKVVAVAMDEDEDAETAEVNEEGAATTDENVGGAVPTASDESVVAAIDADAEGKTEGVSIVVELVAGAEPRTMADGDLVALSVSMLLEETVGVSAVTDEADTTSDDVEADAVVATRDDAGASVALAAAVFTDADVELGTRTTADEEEANMATDEDEGATMEDALLSDARELDGAVTDIGVDGIEVVVLEGVLSVVGGAVDARIDDPEEDATDTTTEDADPGAPDIAGELAGASWDENTEDAVPGALELGLNGLRFPVTLVGSEIGVMTTEDGTTEDRYVEEGRPVVAGTDMTAVLAETDAGSNTLVGSDAGSETLVAADRMEESAVVNPTEEGSAVEIDEKTEGDTLVGTETGEDERDIEGSTVLIATEVESETGTDALSDVSELFNRELIAESVDVSAPVFVNVCVCVAVWTTTEVSVTVVPAPPVLCAPPEPPEEPEPPQTASA
jgi:hypothetical protein